MRKRNANNRLCFKIVETSFFSPAEGGGERILPTDLAHNPNNTTFLIVFAIRILKFKV
ncbi:MAG: hypothetical protein LBR79_03280 [Oscillospiraceae bacterium]|nr:hypothetical protein [Oscillospiraceae bacterium]